MKILAISDVEEKVLYEETKREKIGAVDVIISCGDLETDYLSYISTVYGAPLFYVRGNHDKMLTEQVAGGENLHGRIVQYKSLRLMGFEGGPYFSGDGIEYTDSRMKVQTSLAIVKAKFLGKPDIVVAHTPPSGIHEGGDYSHRGFSGFNQIIEKLQPRFFLHGHTHLNYGRNLPRVTKVNSTTVINVYGYYVIQC